jgi:hypothetical protein
VLTITASQTPLEGEVRLSSRSSIYPEDWRFETVDGPDNGVSVTGFALSILKSDSAVRLAWLAANGNSLPSADQIRMAGVDHLDFPNVIISANYGRPQLPLALDSKGLIFGCDGRVCKTSTDGSTVRLANGALVSSTAGAITSVGKTRYLVTTIGGKLSWIRL